MSDGFKPTLFVRFNGKRVLAAKHLESRLQELSAEVSRLQEVNDVLRAKEAMQFDMLRGHDDSMSRMCNMLCELAQQQDAGRTDTDETVQVLSSVMLTLRDSAQQLLQQLEPSTSSDTDASHSDSGDRSSDSSGSLLPMGPCCGRHMQRLWSRITPQAVLDMRGISAHQLAERIRGDIMRIALARQCASNGLGGLSVEPLEEAVLAYGESVLLAMISADSAFLAYLLYNLETLVPETPAEDLSRHVISQVDLSVKQQQQLVLAYQCFVSQRTALMQQQNAIFKQLQALLSGQRQPCSADSSIKHSLAGLSGASAQAPTDSADTCATPSMQLGSGCAAWPDHSA